MYKPKQVCECFGEIHDEARKKLWDGIFPDGKIPLVHPLREGTAKTGEEVYTFYKVAVDRLTIDQLKEIHKRAADRFNITVQEAEESTKANGIPLKSDGVSVQWCQLHTRAIALSAIGEDDFYDDEDHDEYEDSSDFDDFVK